MIRSLLVALIVLLGASCSKGPCSRGQELREERFPGSAQLRARGCVGRDADGNYRLQGKWEWFHENGQKEAEGAFKDGSAGGEKDKAGIPKGGRHGGWVFWHENGQKAEEANYLDGKQQGLARTWYDNGQKSGEATMKDDKEEGVVTKWYKSGQKRSEAAFKSGKQEGPSIGWYESGRKSDEGKYKNGEAEGVLTEWYENGTKKSEETYKEGSLEGALTLWYENGQKQAEAQFHAGNVVPGSERGWGKKGKPAKLVVKADGQSGELHFELTETLTAEEAAESGNLLLFEPGKGIRGGLRLGDADTKVIEQIGAGSLKAGDSRTIWAGAVTLFQDHDEKWLVIHKKSTNKVLQIFYCGNNWLTKEGFGPRDIEEKAERIYGKRDRSTMQLMDFDSKGIAFAKPRSGEYVDSRGVTRVGLAYQCVSVFNPGGLRHTDLSMQ